MGGSHLFTSGADLTALVREASMAAMKEFIHSVNIGSSPGVTTSHTCEIILTQSHFDIAISRVKPSISQQVSLLSYLHPCQRFAEIDLGCIIRRLSACTRAPYREGNSMGEPP